MQKRLIALFAALLLVFCLSSALAVTYPEKRGAVNDDAAVLSLSTANDIDTLNSRSDVKFTVVTRHFLGGADAQEYADGLFKAWSLEKDDFLLLLVIGEERYACVLGENISGKYISTEQLNSLLSSKLRQYFIQDRDYDGAVGQFLLAAASQAARSQGKSLNTSGFFGSQAQSASNQSESNASSSNSWHNFSSWTGDLWSSFFSDNELNEVDPSDYDYSDYDYDNESGFSTGKLILILAVLFIIIRNRRKNGKSGLGLLGWLTVGVGAKQVMNGIHSSGRRMPPRPPRR